MCYLVDTEKGLITLSGLEWEGKREASVTGIKNLKDDYFTR